VIVLASGKTERRSIPYPVKSDPDTVSSDIGGVAIALDNDAETGNVKLHSELPAAKTRGRIWQVTEGAEKGIWWDTSTTWITVAQYLGKESVTAENIKAKAIEAAAMAANSITEANKALSSESILSSNVKKETLKANALEKKIIGDEQAVTGRALINTGNLPSAKGSVSLNTVYTPSLTRFSLVTVTVGVNAHTIVVLYINKAEYTEVYCAESGVPITVPVFLPVQPAVTWEAKCPTGSVSSLNASTLIL